MEKRSLSGVLFFGGLTLLFLGLQLFADSHYTNPLFPISLIGVGLACLFPVLMIFNEKMPAKVLDWIDRAAGFFRVKTWQLGAIVLCLPLAVVARYASGDNNQMLNPLAALVSWCAAILLATLAGWDQQEAQRPRPSKSLLLSLGAIFLVSFLVRFIFPESIPIYLTGDEGSAGLAAERFASGEINNILKINWFSFPAFYFTIPAFFIKLFGPTIVALKLASALAGALTVVSVFVVLRAAYGTHIAWMGAIFMSMFHFHVHFSRITLNNIWDGLWFTVVVGALWYAWTYERRNAWLLAGLALGLSQYFYSSGRILLALVFGWILIAGLHDRARLKRSRANIFFLGQIALVTMLPLFLFYASHPDEFSAPMNRVSIMSNGWLANTALAQAKTEWRVLLEQFQAGFGAYFMTPSQHWYRPEIPMLRAWPALFFIIGLVFLGFTRPKKFNLLLVFWLAAFGVVGALSESTPAAQRYVAATPAVAMLVAIGLGETTRIFGLFWPRHQKSFLSAAMILVVLLAYSEASFYFFTYTTKSRIDQAQNNSMVGYQMGLYLSQRKDNPNIYFLGEPAMGFTSIPSTKFLAPDVTATNLSFPWGDPQNPPIEGKHLLFIALPFLENELNAIRETYPGGILTTEMAANEKPLYYLYEVIISP